MKLVAFDLDGTLLNNQHQVLKENRDIIQYLVEKEIKVVIATGRSIISATEIIRDIGVPAHILALNGTYITEVTKNGQTKVIRRRMLDRKVVKKALKIASDAEITFIASNETGSDRVVFKGKKEIVQEFLVNRPDLRILSKEQMDKKIEMSSTEYLKIAFTDETIKNLHSLKEALANEGLNTIFSDINYIELVPEGINKGEALSYICEYLNIPIDKTLAFGDQENDIEMLRIANVGVAMGNAQKHVKDAANVVTTTNEESGIAEFLKNYV